MSEIKFNMTVSNIVKFERETGQSLMTAFQGQPSIGTITDLIKATSDADDQKIDEYVKENGLEKLIDGLTTALTDSGFLSQNQLAEATDKAADSPTPAA